MLGKGDGLWERWTCGRSVPMGCAFHILWLCATGLSEWQNVWVLIGPHRLTHQTQTRMHTAHLQSLFPALVMVKRLDTWDRLKRHFGYFLALFGFYSCFRWLDTNSQATRACVWAFVAYMCVLRQRWAERAKCDRPICNHPFPLTVRIQKVLMGL